MTDRLRFEHVPAIDSTNAELMRRPFGAAPADPVAVLADVQHAGRGRNGRGWTTDPSGSIALSVAVERAAGAGPLLGLPLAVGVVVAEVIEARGARIRLKWPNDLLVDTGGRLAKAGGVLVEVRTLGPLQRVVIGCGLNLAPGAALEALRTSQPVAAIFTRESMPDRVALARELAAAMATLVAAFACDGLPAYAARWSARDALAGLPVDLLSPDGRRTPGVARGIDGDGALRVELANGAVQRVLAGDVSVRAR